MPKISEEHRTARREEILGAARRCFGRYGYEGATVARLEAETGLSRGAIFNYFANKEDLFLRLAQRDAERFGRVWAEDGFAGICRDILGSDPEWMGVYFEAARRLRTDEGFRGRWSRRTQQVEREIETQMRGAQAHGDLRDDVPLETLGRFMGIVADGLAVRVNAGLATPDADALIALVADATRPRDEGRRARTRPASRARP